MNLGRYADHSAAFREGYAAWSVVSYEDCPYPEGSKESKDWHDGVWWARYDYDDDRRRLMESRHGD